MLIFLAVCCFIEAFIKTMQADTLNHIGIFEGLRFATTCILWFLMGITFIKIHFSIQTTKENEKKVNNLEAELDYLKKHFNITDEEIKKFIENSKEYELDYTDLEFEELNNEAMNGMTQEEIDTLPYADLTSKEEDTIK